MSDFRKRLTECLKRNGGHLMDVIFGKENSVFSGLNWEKPNGFMFTLYLYVLKPNKYNGLLFIMFLKSLDSVTHPVQF
jgi:hypothetical protein